MFASDYRRLGRQSLQGNWGLSILVCFVAALLGGTATGASSFNLNLDEDQIALISKSPALLTFFQFFLTYALIASFVSFIIGGTIQLGCCQYFLDQYDGKPLAFKTLFSHFFQFANGFCLRLLTDIFTALWTLLFIIPGLVASYRYAMAPFIQAEHPEYSALDCIRASKEMMKGHKLELFCLDWSFFGWILLSVLTLGIGTLFLQPYTSAARTAFYRQLCPSRDLYNAE